MNHIKYRACILILLAAALAFGIWFLASDPAEEQEPFAGATLVTVTGL